MARAILDIPSMPQNCYECPMRRMYRRKWFCQIIMHVAFKDQRRPDCPLKLVDEHCRKAEWVNGKCRGRRISPYTYEVLVQCKNCKDFEEYKEGE